MTEGSGETTEVVDVEDEGFRSAVKEAVRPLVRGLVLLLSLVFIAGSIAVGALVVQANALIQTRKDGLSRTCASDQYFETHHNALAKTNQDVTAKVYGDFAKTLTGDRAQAVRDYAAALAARYEKTKVPIRSCSAGAVEAYIEWLTKHPNAVKCASDGRGYCKHPPTTTP